MKNRALYILAFVTTLQACSPESGMDTPATESGGQIEREQVDATPGEPVLLSDRVNKPADWKAEAGLVMDKDGTEWYLPPFEDGSYLVKGVQDSAVLYELTVGVEGISPDEIKNLEFEGESSVRGTYGGVTFSARTTGDRQAEASFVGKTDELAVEIRSYTDGSVTWKNNTINGKGPLTAEEETALLELAASELASALTFVSLDLACRPGAEAIDASVGAALILPWQLMLKYLTPYPAGLARHYAGKSGCDYFPDATIAPDSPGSRRSLVPEVVMLSNETPLPAAFLYFPLDGEGAKRPPAMAFSK